MLLVCLAAAASVLPIEAAAVPPGPPPSSAIPIVLLRRSEKKAPAGSSGDVLVPARPEADDIARRASAVLHDPAGYGQQVLRLDRFVRTYLLHDPGVSAQRRGTLAQPAFLFLSDREGGYPAESFWLEQPDGRLTEMRDVTFVDMIVDESDLVSGRIDGLQEIYAHELGHLMMAALAGPAPQRASTAMHFVTTRTDAWYAFTEGFGEHFQPVGLDWQRRASGQAALRQEVSEAERKWFGRFEREQVDGCTVCPANLRFLRWHGAREQRLRDAPLRGNQFAFGPSLPVPLVDGSRPPFEARLYRDLALPAAGGPLKNGVQMMESEGVVATLFYRLVNDRRLRDTYREPEFYEPFLDESQAALLRGSGPQAVVSPAENVYLKLFDVMHRSFRWGAWPAVELVAGYAARFPDEAPALYDVFLDVTRGVTVDAEAPGRHASPGYLEGLRDRLTRGQASLDGNIGPAIWMVTPSMTFGLGVFRYFVLPSSFTFDLNAADVPDLLSVPGVSAEVASAILEARDARGYFATVEDLAVVPGLSPGLLSTFRSMREKMQARMSKASPRRAESGWFKDIMVPLLRASYYVAAAWQFGLALLLAGFAFAVSRSTARAMLRAPAASQAAALAGAGERRGWRLWLRRGRKAFARGVAASVVPLCASIALYAAGILPTAANMALVGVVLGAGFVLARAARRRPSEATAAAIVPVLVATVAASAVLGSLY